MKVRFAVLIILYTTAFLALIARLFYWQILKAEELSGQAKSQYRDSEVIRAPRGSILSDDGSPLVKEVMAWLLFASKPDMSGDIGRVADELAPYVIDADGADSLENIIFNEASRLKGILGKSGSAWISLKHRVSQTERNKIEGLDIDGIDFEEEPIREYPEASTAAHLLGFLGKDTDGKDRGYFGLEGFYDVALAGKTGFSSRETDAKGIPITVGDRKSIGAVEGVSLLTRINRGIQITVEKKLKEGIEKYQAKSGTVIVMEPKTGAILAMGSFPSYDPGSYFKYSDNDFRNPAISEAFEPGSVFKIIVMASALDSGVVKPETICDICSGPYRVDKYEIETWNKKYYPDSTMTEVIVHSDNVGMAFVGQKLGADRLDDYLREFGIGEMTGIDLQGEVAPKLREKGDWNVVDLATATFGQGIALTPIQLIRAAGAIANKGVLLKPYVVEEIIGDGWKEKIKMEDGKRVISEDAAKKITLMMVEAAKNGEAKWTSLKGFDVAGKTGTAQIPIAGHYDAEKTIASFIGFAPSEDPKFIMLVTLREPQSSIWASETAAPLWYSIAKDLFIHFGIQPDK